MRAKELADENEKLRVGLLAAREAIMDAQRDTAYWRRMFDVLAEIIAHQKPDPAYEWLAELTRERSIGR